MLSHIVKIFFLYALVLISCSSVPATPTDSSSSFPIVCPWTNYCGPDSSNITGVESKCQCGADRICGEAPWFNCLTCAQCPNCDGCTPPPSNPPVVTPPVETSTAPAEETPTASTAVAVEQPPYNVNANGCGCMHRSGCGPDTCGVTGPLSACQCGSGETCAGYPEFTCLAPGVAKPATGVDFVIWAQAAIDSLSFETDTFDPSGCAYQEKIITDLGQRKLMRFSTQIHNIGTENFMLGSPTDPQNQELFVWSPCHGHYHLYGWSLYQLFDSTGKEVAIGHKQGFCLRDTVRVNNKGPTSPTTTCNNQGITANWGDVYSAQTDGQWIDITNVPSGKYTLRLTVNPNHVFRETNYNNNAVDISVNIP